MAWMKTGPIFKVTIHNKTCFIHKKIETKFQQKVCHPFFFSSKYCSYQMCDSECVLCILIGPRQVAHFAFFCATHKKISDVILKVFPQICFTEQVLHQRIIPPGEDVPPKSRMDVTRNFRLKRPDSTNQKWCCCSKRKEWKQYWPRQCADWRPTY